MNDNLERLRARDEHLAQWAVAEIEALRVGHQRYETARRMNPMQWAEAWEVNLKTGKPFDEIIDNMRPFMFPKGESNE